MITHPFVVCVSLCAFTPMCEEKWMVTLDVKRNYWFTDVFKVSCENGFDIQ